MSNEKKMLLNIYEKMTDTQLAEFIRVTEAEIEALQHSLRVAENEQYARTQLPC